MSQKADRLLKVILVLTSLTMLIVWLPLIRGLMDGDSYEWGGSFLGTDYGGKGLGGQYWILVLEAVVALAIIYLGWRGARQPFPLLLLLWNVSGAINSFYNSIKFPEDYRFQGDTMGIDFSVAWVGPLFWSILTALSIFWVVRDLRKRESQVDIVSGRTNRIFMLIAVALIPIQFVLLRYGPPLSKMDQVGVILTLLQWVMLNLAFAKRNLATR